MMMARRGLFPPVLLLLPPLLLRFCVTMNARVWRVALLREQYACGRRGR